MHNIVFVCQENICSSAMAEAIAKSLCKDQSVIISSAGLRPVKEWPVTQTAVQVMLRRGIDMRSHRSRLLTQKICDAATVLYGMTAVWTQGIAHRFPSSFKKSMMLDTYADIPAPFSQEYEYNQTARLLEEAIIWRFKELGIPF